MKTLYITSSHTPQFKINNADYMLHKSNYQLLQMTNDYELIKSDSCSTLAQLLILINKLRAVIFCIIALPTNNKSNQLFRYLGITPQINKYWIYLGIKARLELASTPEFKLLEYKYHDTLIEVVYTATTQPKKQIIAKNVVQPIIDHIYVHNPGHTVATVNSIYMLFELNIGFTLFTGSFQDIASNASVNNYNNILIITDKIVLHKKFIERVAKILTTIAESTDWDIISLSDVTMVSPSYVIYPSTINKKFLNATIVNNTGIQKLCDASFDTTSDIINLDAETILSTNISSQINDLSLNIVNKYIANVTISLILAIQEVVVDDIFNGANSLSETIPASITPILESYAGGLITIPLILTDISEIINGNDDIVMLITTDMISSFNSNISSDLIEISAEVSTCILNNIETIVGNITEIVSNDISTELDLVVSDAMSEIPFALVFPAISSDIIGSLKENMDLYVIPEINNVLTSDIVPVLLSSITSTVISDTTVINMLNCELNAFSLCNIITYPYGSQNYANQIINYKLPQVELDVNIPELYPSDLQSDAVTAVTTRFISNIRSLSVQDYDTTLVSYKFNYLSNDTISKIINMEMENAKYTINSGRAGMVEKDARARAIAIKSGRLHCLHRDFPINSFEINVSDMWYDSTHVSMQIIHNLINNSDIISNVII